MALYPYGTQSRDVLQPGARGEMFVNDGIPGHRNEGDRINRTNNHLGMNDHDVLNIKYGVDPRLPVLFRYGWASGYNQIIMPKGRIVAADPHLMVMDTDTLHFHNALTLANGGVDVDLVARAHDGKNAVPAHWVEAATQFVVDDNPESPNAGKDKNNPDTRRPANVPLGILERNEYTRDSDAFNGIMAGPIRTDALVDLPWFLKQEDAEKNPWGCAHGALKPGMLVKSDMNGRITVSPLSDPAKVAVMTMDKYEAERQQVIGTVYATDQSLLPEGAARYAQWALSDRLNFDDINPFVWPNNGRAGEDFVKNPPTMYQSDFTYPGYPYDRSVIANDLHMLASTREGNYDPRFDEAHRLDRGIPGLTDGGNAVVKAYGAKLNDARDGFVENAQPGLTISHVVELGANNFDEEKAQEIMFRLPDTDLEKAIVAFDDAVGVDIVAGAKIGAFEVQYVDLHKGLFSMKQVEAGTATEGEGEAEKPVDVNLAVKIAYIKKGEAGVPTNLDWDGCVGTVQILLQK